MNKSIKGIAIITTAHALISWTLSFMAFILSMGRFDSGAEASSGEEIMATVSDILLWPIIAPLTEWGPRWLHDISAGLLGYIWLLLNSLIWGIVLWWINIALKSRPQPSAGK